MPAVQTENSDGWPSMEQPQTTELVSVVAAPEDSSNLDSPPSETVISEKQDVKPECVPVPDIRWRRSMTLPDYKKTFLSGWITTSAPRFMSVPLRNGKSLSPEKNRRRATDRNILCR